MSIANQQRRLVIGTAGHIDHGKSTLVRVLTGTDPDRLPEEQARGMTIDLGFAFWEHGIAFVDVPGHERFVKNMVAGATGIDAALLVVAADDGVMPQTREHYAILSLLGVQRGIVAITKASLADPVWLDMVIEDVRTMLASGTLSKVSILSVDSLTQQGIPELRIALQQLAESVPARSSHAVFSLAIDRVFTKPGFGTVVTGTVSGGEVKVGDTIEIQPKNITVRVRGIQSQNIARERVGSGERAAINITGIDREAVERGDRLCEPGVFTATTEIDVQATAMGLEPIKHRSRVRFHCGTAEIIGRLDFLDQTFLQPGESTFARFQAETPFVTQFHERFVIRRYSPAETIGGGIVLNPNPLHRLRASENVEWLPQRLLTQEKLQSLLAAVAETEPMAASISRLSIALSQPKAVLIEQISSAKNDGRLLECETRVLRVERFTIEKQLFHAQVIAFQKDHPERVGIPTSTILPPLQQRIGTTLADQLVSDLLCQKILECERGYFRTIGFVPVLSQNDAEKVDRLLLRLASDGLSPTAPVTLSEELNIPEKELHRLIELLRERGEVTVLEGRLWFLSDLIQVAFEHVLQKLKEQVSLSAAEIAAELNTSRKSAIAIVEEMDRRNLTERIGDVRRLKIK